MLGLLRRGRRKYTTENSVYEVDARRKRARRLRGTNAPTANFGQDGAWRPYADYGFQGDRLIFIWDDQGRATITSRLVGR